MPTPNTVSTKNKRIGAQPIKRLAAAFAALVAGLVMTLAPQDANAQASVQIMGKFGFDIANATGLPANPNGFGLGGGGNAAAMLRFDSGIRAGLNFDYFGAPNTVNAPSGNPASLTYHYPSIGLIVGLPLTKIADIQAFLNFAFPFATLTPTGSGTPTELAGTGATIGAMAHFTYQFKPYKTYLLFSPFLSASLVSYAVEQQGSEQVGLVSSIPFQIGLAVGVRFDTKL